MAVVCADECDTENFKDVSYEEKIVSKLWTIYEFEGDESNWWLSEETVNIWTYIAGRFFFPIYLIK